MQPIIIKKERIISPDSRLKAHVNHDPRSRDFAAETSGVEIRTVMHPRNVPILDQGQFGSCTGNAAIGCIYSGSYVHDEFPVFQPTEDGAKALYSAAECIDGDGPFPPHDNGSSGLSVAKALKSVGMIKSYRHAFSLEAALKALQSNPVIVGVNWYSDMYVPDADGRIRITGELRGRHEFVVRGCDAEKGLVMCDQSWGASWGAEGRFLLSWEDLGTLLGRSGDVIQFVQ